MRASQATFLTSILCVVAALSVTAQQARDPGSQRDPGAVLLGVLEHGWKDARRSNRTIEYRRARVLFRKTSTGWEPLSQLPKDPASLDESLKQFPDAVSWTIAFDGRRLGAVNTVNPKAIRDYVDFGVQPIPDDVKVPRIGKPSGQFSGYLAYLPTYHPLV